MESQRFPVGKRSSADHPWWDDIPEARKMEIRELGQEGTSASAGGKHRVRRGCGLVFFAIIIRLYCFVMGVVELGCGGWILYQLSNNKLAALPILSNVAQGGFLILGGFLALLAETRTKRTMERCLNTYIILSNYLARAIFYIVVGGLTFPMNFQIMYIGKYGNSKILAGLIVAGGLMNLVYTPFHYRYQRKKRAAEHTVVTTFPEEVAYITDASQIQIPSSSSHSNPNEGDQIMEKVAPSYSDVTRDQIASGADV